MKGKRRLQKVQLDDLRVKYALLDIRAVYAAAPYRMEADKEGIELLAASIARHGQLQPILVRKSPQFGQYLLVCGARRLAACGMAGLTRVHAMVMEGDESDAAACWIEEHLTRRVPRFLDETAVVCRAGVERVRRRFALPQAFLDNRLRMLSLPASVQDMIKKRGLTLEQAQPLLAIESEQRQLEAAEIIAQRGLSHQQARRLVCGPEARDDFSGRRRGLSAAVAAVHETVRRLRAHGFEAQAGMYSQEEGVCIQIYLKSLRVSQRSAGNSKESSN